MNTSVNRRSFVKAAGALAATGAVAGVATASADEATTATETETVAKHTWEIAPEPITDIAETKDYDIVIVGSGFSGLAAAEAAARNGATVVVLEKTEAISYRGQDVAGINSKWQQEQGTEIDPDLAASNLFLWTHQNANYELIRGWAYNCGKTIDHIAELANAEGYGQCYGVTATSKVGWDDESIPEKYREYPTPISFPDKTVDYNASFDSIGTINKGVAEPLWHAAENDGAEFLFNTKAEQLVGDAKNGITGVIATDADGNHVQFNAAKGVVLATGDIGGNQEMIDAFCPIANRVDMKMYTPLGGNTGDGVNMGCWAGAALQRTTAAPMIHQFCTGSFNFFLDAFIMSWLSVNRYGVRYASEMNFEPYVTNARMTQPGNVSWSIFDSNWKEHIQVQWPTKYESWISQIEDGDQINAALESGYLIQADTIEELAEKIEVPADALQQTIDTYNGYCDAGEDVQFRTPAQFLASVKEPPFYACKVAATMLVVPFGLHVDRNSQVCTEQDEPIEGLYAVGNVQGDFFCYDYPVQYPGLSHSRALTYGQLVGEALAKDVKITDIMD